MSKLLGGFGNFAALVFFLPFFFFCLFLAFRIPHVYFGFTFFIFNILFWFAYEKES